MTTQTSTFTDRSELILGVARTGAKFTPNNHKLTDDRIFDAISSGDMIPVDFDEIRTEIATLYRMGVRYIHEHARNPKTREQTTDLEVYREVSRIVQEQAPDALLSFGGSRNGREITEAIRQDGEIARVAQAGLARTEGGADFVTTQAAIELQIVTDMERQGYIAVIPSEGRFKLLKPLADYVPSGSVEEARFEVNSTAGGANYGVSSAAVQHETLLWTLDARERLGKPYEVEWVQEARSSFLTWYLANAMPNGVRRVGRLNITLLFGFSPRLPFPRNHAEFCGLVRKARAIATPVEGGDSTPLRISISVGSAVLPQHAAHHMRPVDVGPLAGMPMGPMEILSTYAAQPNSQVDILRVGIEDTPYALDPQGRLLPTSNAELAQRSIEVLEAHDVKLVTDPKKLSAFGSV